MNRRGLLLIILIGVILWAIIIYAGYLLYNLFAN